MGLEARVSIIKEIEKKRDSRVICCINGDRQCRFPIPGMSTQILGEPHLNLYEHLLKIGKTKKIDLVLYTRGGSIDAVWPMVNLIREFCDYFSVLVPFRAHSAGTLICLGARQMKSK